jgi:hypothetical protein
MTHVIPAIRISAFVVDVRLAGAASLVILFTDLPSLIALVSYAYRLAFPATPGHALFSAPSKLKLFFGQVNTQTCSGF